MIHKEPARIFSRSAPRYFIDFPRQRINATSTSIYKSYDCSCLLLLYKNNSYAVVCCCFCCCCKTPKPDSTSDQLLKPKEDDHCQTQLSAIRTTVRLRVFALDYSICNNITNIIVVEESNCDRAYYYIILN